MGRYCVLGAAMALAFAATSGAEGPESQRAPEAPHEAGGWELSIGGGAIAGPAYLGSDTYELSVVPYVRAAYGDVFFASVQEGVGYNVVNTEDWRAGPLARIDFGREEDGEGPFRIAGDDSDDLAGLGDVDATAELGGFVERTAGPWELSLELRQGLSGHEGFVGDASASYTTRTRVGRTPLILSAGPSFRFGDEDYVGAYFGVDADQAAASGYDEFEAEAGIVSYSLNATAIVPVSQRAALTGFAGYTRVAENAADSPIVSVSGDEDQVTLGAFYSYRFGG